ncbi:hypothetical protein Hanom_Chr01g00053791 [Helianthus anomalus]
MVRIRHFEFLCQLMHIEPTVNRFRVFYQMHCSQGLASFAQRASAKKILSNPPKSFHDWKPKFFFIKAGVIPVKMGFRGKEDVVPETIQNPFSETWYQDLKNVPSIELPKKALVAKVERWLLFQKRLTLNFGTFGKNFAFPQDEDLFAQPPTGAVVKKPKAESRDTADIPASNLDDPIDLELTPEPLVKMKTGKRKQAEVEAGA